MTEIQAIREQESYSLRNQLRQKNNKMLAFLYNVEYSFAAQQFDKKFDPHLQLKKIQKSQSIKREQLRRLFLTLSQKLHDRIIREDVQADKALNKLQSLWQTRKIQIFHRYYFQKFLMTTFVNSTHALIKHQDNLIRNQQHIYFSIYRAIWAREAALNQLSRSLKSLGPEDIYQHLHTLKERQIQRNRKIQQRQYKVHGYRVLYRLDEQQVNLGKTKMEVLSQDINNYRKITLHVIRLIVTWREYILSLTPDLRARKQRFEFYYEEKNYLLTVLNDSNFIATTFLNNFYIFSNRNDPLLLRPVLNIQKRQMQGKILTFQQHQLKKIIQIKEIDFNNITFTIQQLYNEVQAIIRNRKILDNYSFSKLKSMSLDQPKNPVQLSPNKRPKLNPLSTFKSQTLKKTNLGDKQQSQSSLTKSNVLIRKISQIQTKSPTKTFYKSQKSQNNPETNDPYRMLNTEQLLKLKEQVYEKIRTQLQFQARKNIIKSKQFEQLVDIEVKANLSEILQKQSKQLNPLKLQITPLCIMQQEIGSFLTKISKQIPISCLQMQQEADRVAMLMFQSEYIYILKIHTSHETLGHAIGRVSKQTKQYKLIQIMYVSFRKVQNLSKVMQKVVQFMWKYESVRQLVFTFSAANSASQKTLKQLQQSLSQYCTVINKKRSQKSDFVFTFSKKANNQNYTYNPYPLQMHIKLYSALTTQPLKIDSLLENQEYLLHYDYLVMQMLRLYTNSEDFIVLRDTFRPKERFRHLLKLMLQMESHKDNEIEITALSAATATELNQKLMHLKKPFMQVSDLIKINNIKALLFELTLSPAYKLKVLPTRDGVKMHRYRVQTSLDCMVDDEGSEFLLLEVHQSHHQKIMIYNADNFLLKQKRKLNAFLFQKMQKCKKTKKRIANLWIQMARYPKTLTEQQQHYISTFASNSQFSSINKHLFIADYFDWFTDIKIQTGITYQIAKDDLIVKKPFGVSVVVNGVNVLYSRVFQ